MSAWLDPVRAALDTASSPVTFWFRDDDAGWDDDALDRLLDRCHQHSVQLDLAVIPVDLRDDLATSLRDHAATGIVHLHQHGFCHRNHETEGRKCEFGPSRSRAQQRQDMADGQALLRGHLGTFVEPVFTPPWNRCTDDTAAALVELGIRVLSRDSTATPFGHPDLAEVSITVDWFASYKGERLSRAEVGERIAAQVADGSAPVGVMLHHAVTDAVELALIDQLMSLIDEHQMATSSSILRLEPARRPRA